MNNTEPELDTDVLPIVSGIERATDAAVRSPYFHISSPRDTTGLCYIVSSLIRWRCHYDLVQGQVAWFSTPAGGALNLDLEIVLYVMLGRIRACVDNPHKSSQSYGRWEILLDGQADAASTALPGESASYTFAPDSHLGFLGNKFEIKHLEWNEVSPLFWNAAPASIEARGFRYDGAQHWQPKFYCTASNDEPHQRMWEATTQSWIKVRPMSKFESPVFLPSVNKDERWVSERQRLELRLGSKLGDGRNVFVGNQTLVLPDSTDKQEIQSTLHDTADGFALMMTHGIRPTFSRITRLGSRTDNNQHLNQVLNAYGQHVWQAQLSR